MIVPTFAYSRRNGWAEPPPFLCACARCAQNCVKSARASVNNMPRIIRSVETVPRNVGDALRSVTKWSWNRCLRHPEQVHNKLVVHTTSPGRCAKGETLMRMIFATLGICGILFGDASLSLGQVPTPMPQPGPGPTAPPKPTDRVPVPPSTPQPPLMPGSPK